jgi:pimeloyl-ACP methyl ester carboxylesterase
MSMTVQPFRIAVPNPVLNELQERLAVQRWTVMPRGGHFAAMEQPELLAGDIRAMFASSGTVTTRHNEYSDLTV